MEINEAVDLQVKVKELTEALNAEKRRNAELRTDFAAKLDAEADVRAEQRVAQQQALDEDAAEQAKPKVLTRPKTYAELKNPRREHHKQGTCGVCNRLSEPQASLITKNSRS